MKKAKRHEVETVIINGQKVKQYKEGIFEDRANPEPTTDITDRDLQIAFLGMLKQSGLINDRVLAASADMVMKGGGLIG